jgi:hypothetical protein
LPDEGEWECADVAGVVVCRGGEPAAGTAPGAPGRGFRCGSRRTAGGKDGASVTERLCIDLAPGLPEGAVAGVRCHFEATRGLSRVCDLAAVRPSVGSPCRREQPCVDGAVCFAPAGAPAGGRCVPRRPDLDCWLATDCGGDPCRFGSCFREKTE